MTRMFQRTRAPFYTTCKTFALANARRRNVITRKNILLFFPGSMTACAPALSAIVVRPLTAPLPFTLWAPTLANALVRSTPWNTKMWVDLIWSSKAILSSLPFSMTVVASALSLIMLRFLTAPILSTLKTQTLTNSYACRPESLHRCSLPSTTWFRQQQAFWLSVAFACFTTEIASYSIAWLRHTVTNQADNLVVTDIVASTHNHGHN